MKTLLFWIAIIFSNSSFCAPQQDFNSIVEKEGFIRQIVLKCFDTMPSEKNRLMELSRNYVQRLSAVSGVSVSDLEARVPNARDIKVEKITLKDCEKAQKKMIQLFDERDRGL